MCFVLILINFEPKKQQFLTKPRIFFPKIASTLLFFPLPPITGNVHFIHRCARLCHWKCEVNAKFLLGLGPLTEAEA